MDDRALTNSASLDWLSNLIISLISRRHACRRRGRRRAQTQARNGLLGGFTNGEEMASAKYEKLKCMCVTAIYRHWR